MDGGLQSPLIDQAEVDTKFGISEHLTNKPHDRADHQQGQPGLVSLRVSEEHGAALPLTTLVEAYETTLCLFGRFRKRMINCSPVIVDEYHQMPRTKSSNSV